MLRIKFIKFREGLLQDSFIFYKERNMKTKVCSNSISSSIRVSRLNPMENVVFETIELVKKIIQKRQFSINKERKKKEIEREILELS